MKGPKVFCNECRFRMGSFSIYGPNCAEEHNRVLKPDTYDNRGSYVNGLCFDINLDNDCDYFLPEQVDVGINAEGRL